jgi:multisubunit Na+/H+ antiporter MnhB subunit
MSSATLLSYIQQNVFQIGGPILIVIGSISCILNLMVFTKDTLRKHTCAMCFVAVNIINFLYTYLGLLLTTLAVGYDIDPSAISMIFCRFRYYIALVLACWGSSWHQSIAH